MYYATASIAIATLLLTSSAAAQHLVYDAGDAGNPPVAPSPTTAGWIEYLAAPATAFDISPDTDWNINAWQLHDPGNGRAGYRHISSPDDGFVFSMEMRSLAASTWFYYDSGDLIVHNIFEVEFEIQGADIVVDSHPVSGPGTPLVCPGATDGAYHTFALVVRSPTDFFLDLYYDGASWEDSRLVWEHGYRISSTGQPSRDARFGIAPLQPDHVQGIGVVSGTERAAERCPGRIATIRTWPTTRSSTASSSDTTVKTAPSPPFKWPSNCDALSVPR